MVINKKEVVVNTIAGSVVATAFVVCCTAVYYLPRIICWSMVKIGG